MTYCSKSIPIAQAPRSKKQQILEHLLAGKTLTQWECTHLYRHLRLGAVVHELRRAGYNIITVTKRNANDSGTHAMYFMERPR